MPHPNIPLPALHLPDACNTCPSRQKDCPADTAAKLYSDHSLFVRYSTPQNPYTQIVSRLYHVNTDPVTADSQLTDAATHLRVQAEICSHLPETERPVGTIGMLGIRATVENHNPYN